MHHFQVPYNNNKYIDKLLVELLKLKEEKNGFFQINKSNIFTDNGR